MSKLAFNEETGTFVKTEEIKIVDTTDKEEIKQSLKIELAGIIQQVKGLKRRAEEINVMLNALDGKSGSIAPDPAESQSPLAE